jgi:hypothetical protein
LASPTTILVLSRSLGSWPRDRRMFTIHCENIVRAAIRKADPQSPDGEVESLRLTTRIASLFSGATSHLASPRGSSLSNVEGQRRTPQRLRPDMIRRIDDAPKLLNPSGLISEGQAGSTDLRLVAQLPSEGLHDSLPSSRENRSRSPIESIPTEESRVGRSPKRRW